MSYSSGNTMKNLMNKLVVTLFLLFLFFISCSKNEIIRKDVLKNSDTEFVTVSNNTMTSPNTYFVSERLLYKFLRTFRKNKIINKIEPINKEGLIVAYYIEYANNKGWKLVAADKRVAPILASSDENTIDLNELGLAEFGS